MNEQYTFNLSETLAWQKGFAIDEILGIALVPELSMETADNYLSIRGVIELKGEFYPKKEETTDLRVNHDQLRTVDNIEVMEDGPYSFFHHFPVEVSIPLSRVHNVNDVEVEITRFDYNLPNSKSLGVFAVLSLNGVLGESVEDINELTLEEEYRDQTNLEAPNAFENEEYPLDIPEDNKIINLHPENSEAELENFQNEQRDLDNEHENDKENQNKNVEEIRNDKEEVVDDNNEELTNDLLKPQENDFKNEKDHAVEIKVDEVQEVRADNSYQDSSYLLNMFNEKEGPQFKQLKMHLVQDDDTLEKIAERYQMPQTKLLTINQLDNSELKIGDIIYIPISSESSS